MTTPLSQEWSKKLRKIIEDWHYQAGDDVLASALADEVIEDVENLLADHDKELVKGLEKMKDATPTTGSDERKLQELFNSIIRSAQEFIKKGK